MQLQRGIRRFGLGVSFTTLLTRLSVSGVLALALTLVAGPAWAHHSVSRFSDRTKRVTLTGTLTKVEWLNPHVLIFLAIKGGQDQTESWVMEGNSPVLLKERGINKDAFQKAIGQIVIVEASLAKDGSRQGLMYKVTFADGTISPPPGTGNSL